MRYTGGVLVLRLTLEFAEVFSCGEKTGYVCFSVKQKNQNQTFFTPQMNICTDSQKFDTTGVDVIYKFIIKAINGQFDT